MAGPKKPSVALRALRKERDRRKKIAAERIEILFSMAERMAKEKRLGFAKRYVELARRISTKYKVRLPKDLKRRFCRECSSYLLPPVNCSVRLDSRNHRVVVRCLSCGSRAYYPYVRERKQKVKTAARGARSELH